MTEPITLAECKRAGICFEGAKEFVERSGLDFRHFARNGISVEDAMAKEGWGAFVQHILSVRAQRGQEK